jgi:hypothetical protein
MKKVIAGLLFLVLAGSLQAQSLAELSRREKARRESLQGKHARIITNADLESVRKSPIFISSSNATDESNASAANNPQNSVNSSPASSKSAPTIRMVPTVGKPGPVLFKRDDKSPPGAVGDLESRLKAARELVDLLTTKMNALWQEFYNMNAMTTQDAIQQQIDETYQKLIKAQEDENNLRARWESSKGNPQEKR